MVGIFNAMSTDQLAAEAWDEIYNANANRPQGIAIIKSVIEKATEIAVRETSDYIMEKLRQEPLAHASEQETPEYQQFLAECAKHCRCSMTICESVLAGAPCEERIEPNDLDDNLP